MARLKSYHFDLGNSSVGPVGFCARVSATSKVNAVAKLHARLDEDYEVPYDATDGEIGEYLCVYFNHDAITVKDIDEWEWEERSD